MKLHFIDINDSNDIILENSYIYCIECLNHNYFIKLLDDVYYSISKELSFLEKDKSIDMSKDSLILSDYYNYDLILKLINTKLLKYLEKYYTNNNEFEKIVIDLNNNLSKIIDVIDEDFSIEIDYDIPTSVIDYLKLLSIRINISVNNKLDLLINILSVVSDLKLFKIIVLINVKSFFTEDELKVLYNHLQYCSFYPIIIENTYSKLELINEKKIVIDEDLFDYVK